MTTKLVHVEPSTANEPNERIEVASTAVSETADELNDTTALEQAPDTAVRRYPARTRKQPDWLSTYVAH